MVSQMVLCSVEREFLPARTIASKIAVEFDDVLFELAEDHHRTVHRPCRSFDGRIGILHEGVALVPANYDSGVYHNLARLRFNKAAERE